MKKLCLFSTLLIFILVSGCKQKDSGFDPEIEKAEILKVFDLNMALLQNNDKQGLIDFLKKYNMPQSYLITGDTLIFIDNTSKSDEELIKGFDQDYTSVSHIIPPMITFSPDGKMAYVIDKLQLKWKKDSIEKKGNLAFFQIMNKVDSVWKMGDSMMARETADILASANTEK